jgi:hypothetical protein
MQLRVARLCLDCEEIHDAQQCPVCASETFAFMTRWVPAPERRANPRTSGAEEAGDHERVTALRSLARGRLLTGGRVLTGGALGLAALGAAGWLLRGSGKSGQSPRREPDQPTGVKTGESSPQAPGSRLPSSRDPGLHTD